MRLLYKYFPIQTAEHVSRMRRLAKGWIYVSSPASFNDPFEMSPVLAPPTKATVEDILTRVRATEAGVSKTAQRKVVEGVQAKIRMQAPPAVGQKWVASMGVLCLTVDPKDLLMWAHYASSHTGLCLGFDSNHAPFDEARPVKYLSERPSLSGLDPTRLDARAVEDVLLRKSPHWKYEQEWRVVKRPVRDDEKDFYRAQMEIGAANADDVANLLATQGGPGYYHFGHQALKRVIFGAKIAKAFKAQIRSSLIGCDDVKFLQAEIDRKYFVLNLLPEPDT
jgi:hypothetical protein